MPELTGPQAKFLAALRSGEFAQGRGALREVFPDGGHAYCCLGVACEIYRRETGRGDWSGSYFRPDPGTGDDLPFTVLPNEVMAWLGAANNDPVLAVPDTANRWIVGETATHFNDIARSDFIQIAELFEAYFLKINADT